MAASRNKRSTDLAERVGVFLAARVSPTDRLSVGLSGGCDSVVLLHALCRSGHGQRLNAIHVHHGLSSNADAWAEHCQLYCGSLGIPITVHRVSIDPASREGLEAAARAARYAAFSEVDAECLLLAHHRGDQAETVLFNLLRGSGITGAAGMPAERRFGSKRLLRPLLDCGRTEIEDYARQHGLSWVVDESNADTRFARNYLRHSTMGSLVERFPMAESSLSRAAANFGEALGLLDELAELDWRFVAEDDSADMRRLRMLSLQRLKNLLRYRLRVLGWQVPVTSRLDEFARQLLSAGPDRHPALQLPGGRMVVMQRRLHWLVGKYQ